MTVMLFLNIFVAIASPLAVWFIGRKEEWSRWGYIIGLSAQPAWFYITVVTAQWGIFTVTCFFMFSWCQGIWNYWIKG